jgi:hypothetical protein
MDRASQGIQAGRAVIHYLQPHEGVTGIDRSDTDLLFLTDGALSRRQMMMGQALLLHSACLTYPRAPVIERMWERITHPEIGDLVMATDHRTREHKAFGYLVEERKEWWTTDKEWEETLAKERAYYEEHYPGEDVEPEERLTDYAHYIQYGPQPADVCRWTNCTVIMVPTDPQFCQKSIGVRDPAGGVTITRETLLGSLADSGITLNPPNS